MCRALAGTDVRSTVLRRWALRPQLKRDPLGTNAPGAPSHCYMRLVLFSLIVVALIAGLWWWGKRPRIYRNVPLNGLRRFIWSLLAQMASGGFLVADRRGGAGFLQLALRSASDDSYAIEFGLPEIDWSAPHFEAVHAALLRQHFEVAVEQGSDHVSQFMRVTISGHSEEVIGRAMTLFEVVADTLGWGTSPTFTVRFGGPLDVPRIRAQLAAARGRGA